ncbi:amidohydrolase family protein [Bradyrhizobium sp. KB893862 SZCCT0404]|uniref:amidohydrolase family protein n=1 Tax=Bradyrhizobium sp. KB893862 SZCCT0404 TaxID=2807672 RepID=UPI001BAA0467|nr:amidohydrolase family protein [Bradyrhizobium sp. KB893862 SZCCT0404]MBR1175326.1 amidohydrolase family protein [Bradyrhizobium sp. KB893862 SZCCT0404]
MVTDAIAGERLTVPNSTGTAPPNHAAPVGAVDCHYHVFDPAFPPPSGSLTTIGTKHDYALFRRRIGLSRSVLIGASTYGLNNDCFFDALRFFGNTARGVAIVPQGASREEVRQLHRQGVRGIRIYLGRGDPASPQAIRDMAALIADFGWNIEIVVSHHSELLCEVEPVLAELPCRVVLGHFAFVRQPNGLMTRAGQSLRRLLDRPQTWLKLSGVYHVSAEADGFKDVDPMARDLICQAPDRMVWGSDWPHTRGRSEKPDGAALFDQLWSWADEEIVRRILVDNPKRLYWDLA